ncbi:hypothetical protein ABBQ38_006567 [Trebouxia sp. C0009 RCD-2024]
MCATIESKLRKMTETSNSVKELVKRASRESRLAKSKCNGMSNKREHEFAGAVKDRI